MSQVLVLHAHEQPHLESIFSPALMRNVNVCICRCVNCQTITGECICQHCSQTAHNTHKKKS